MNNKLECEIVRDLLPSYADNLTSAVTSSAVEEHLAQCPACAEILSRMKESEEPSKAATEEVDYLKKVRRNTKRTSLIIGICLMLIGMGILAFVLFYVGVKASPEDAAFTVSVENGTVTVEGNLIGSGVGVARVTFDEGGGIVNVTVYTALKTMFNKGEFKAEYKSTGEVGAVRCGDRMLWEDGKEISAITSRLYAATSPFVGDMPANGKIAEILGISQSLGGYTNELQTTAEPYGWTIVLKSTIDREREGKAEEIMRADACAMIATIKNLGYVTWQYNTEDGRKEYTVTEQDATEYTGGDIKKAAESPSKLEALVNTLEIGNLGSAIKVLPGREFFANINIADEDEIYYVEISYYLNEKLAGASGTTNADESPFRKGDDISFDFNEGNFTEKISSEDLSEFSFDLYVEGGDRERVCVCKNRRQSVVFGETVSFTLHGTFDGGFTLSERE